MGMPMTENVWPGPPPLFFRQAAQPSTAALSDSAHGELALPRRLRSLEYLRHLLAWSRPKGPLLILLPFSRPPPPSTGSYQVGLVTPRASW